MLPTIETTLRRSARPRRLMILLTLVGLTPGASTAATSEAVQTFPGVTVTVPSVPLVNEEMGAASVDERDFLHTLSRFPVPADQLELTEGEPIPTHLDPLSPGLSSSIESVSFTEDAGLNGYYFIPADPHGAVGPGHVVSVVNSSVRWHTTGGTLQGNMRLGLNSGSSIVGSFFEPLTPINSLFDPKVIYDTQAGHFIVVALEKRDSPQTSRILVAASDDSDPNGTWYYLAIDSKVNVSGTDYWADYPSLGVDEEALYITNNLFSWPGSGIGCRLWIVDKTALYSGSPLPAVRYDPYASLGISGFNTTSMVAQVYGTPPPGAAGTWLVSYSGLSDGTNEFVGVLRVDNPLGSPTFAYAQVNCGNIDNTSVPLPDAPQPGTAQTLETNDQRALNAVWRANGLYLCAQVTPPSGSDAGQSTAHWWQLSTASLATPTLAGQGNIGGEELGAATHTSFPSIAVSAAGDVAVGFSAAGANLYPGAYYAARTAGDPAGTMQTPVAVAAGVDYYYRAFGGPRNRWGDYSATVIDPAGTTFWVFNKYALSRGTILGSYPSEDGRWGTRWGSFTMSAPSPLTAALTAPNGGESWGFGTLHAVTWTASGGTGAITVDLDWSANNGGAWSSVATGLANTGTYNWSVPATATAQALVRVTAHDAAAGSAADASNAVFTLADLTAPTVSVTAPAGGATLTAGSGTTITWTASDNVSVTSVNIDHSTNNGGSWGSLAVGIPNSGSTAWTPSVATVQGRIRVTAFDAAGNSQAAQSGMYTVVNPDVTPPTATVTAPNGGENLAMGSSVSITWSASDNIGVTSVALSYSTNGGGSFTPIASGLANSGSYSWTVPAVITSQGRVRVVASDAAALTGQDDSNANFNIVDATLPVVSVTAPTAGNNWVVGSGHTVTWVATDNVGVTSVDVDYSTNNGGAWTSVATGEANDGSYGWTLPNTPTAQARVRVRAFDAAANTGSGQSAAFTISAAPDVTPPTATLTAPNGGESLAMGSGVSITWSASDDVAVTSVALSYSTNGGGSYTTIVSGLANSGSYSWTVPAVATNQGRIRVVASDAAAHTGQDESNANFSIVDATLPVVSVTSPTIGNSWVVGSVHSLTWVATDNVGVTSVALDYSTNNGGAWISVATGEANDGSYSWTVPNTPTAQARIRIRAADAAGNSGSGQSGAFTLAAAADLTPPTATVTAPNGGEILAMGSSVSITWDALDNIGVTGVALSYSTNGGGSYATIASGMANSGSYLWTVPAAATTQGRVRVVATDGAGNAAQDDSDANFSIVDQTAPTVTLSQPAAGSSWQATTTRSITWSATDNLAVTGITLDYSTNNGGSWTTISAALANTGGYDWVIPSLPTTQARVRVIAADAAGNTTTVTGNSFTITAPPDLTPPSVSVTAPNGGEAWPLASARTITWTAADNIAVTSVTIAYSANGGAAWTTLSAAEANDGSYSWTTPPTPTTQGRVRVTARDAIGNSASDDSDASFSLVDVTAPTVAVLSPATGNIWTAGTVHTVSWSAGDNVGITVIAIDFSGDNGASWLIVAGGEANDGAYTWTVPALPTTQARIRVTALDAAGNSGSGQSGQFTVLAAPDVAPPTITVTGPNGGENLAMGALVAVTWSATDNVGVTSIGIDLSTNGGASWSPVAGNEPNDGQFDWTVPNVSTTQGLLRLMARDAANNSALDLSNSGFAISDQTDPALTLTSPSEAVSWVASSLHTLLWTASDNVGVASMEIDWSGDDGGSWASVAAGEPNDGSYDWVLPDASTDAGRVRLTAVDAAGNRTTVLSALITVQPIVPIALASFLALRDGADVRIRWDVAGEGSRALFHLHRSSDGAPRTPLTDRPLSGARHYEYRDTDAPTAAADYWLEEIEPSGQTHWYGPAGVAAAGFVGGFPALAPARPNPFREATTLAYSLPAAAPVRLAVHDIQGRAIVTLTLGLIPAGSHQFHWDGRDGSRNAVAPGIYFVTFEALGRTVTRKVVRAR